jgi:hypothetical protein
LAHRRCILLAAAFLLATACGDDDTQDSPPDPTTTTTDPTTTTLSPEEEVETAYLAFANMGARLLQAPDPDDPEIAQRTSGQARDNLVDGLTTLKTSGQHYELGPAYSQQVMSVTVAPSRATAVICVVEDSQLMDTLTGAVVAMGLTTVEWTVTLVPVERSWLVDEIVEGEVQEGAVECR